MSAHREALLQCMQGEADPFAGDSVPSSYLLVVELLTADGTRGVVRITSDANGRALPWHMAQGLAAAAAQLDDFDESERVNDGEH